MIKFFISFFSILSFIIKISASEILIDDDDDDLPINNSVVHISGFIVTLIGFTSLIALSYIYRRKII